jgi:heat shock protein HtpX
MDMKQSRRKLGDLMMNVDKYAFINCACGLKLKIPPDYPHETTVCPKCGRKHRVIKD